MKHIVERKGHWYPIFALFHQVHGLTPTVGSKLGSHSDYAVIRRRLSSPLFIMKNCVKWEARDV